MSYEYSSTNAALVRYFQLWETTRTSGRMSENPDDLLRQNRISGDSPTMIEYQDLNLVVERALEEKGKVYGRASTGEERGRLHTDVVPGEERGEMWWCLCIAYTASNVMEDWGQEDIDSKVERLWQRTGIRMTGNRFNRTVERAKDLVASHLHLAGWLPGAVTF